MDLNRAATFLQVVESGGFTAAATALGLPTSSVSRSIARLEQDLGVVLLERTTRRVTLTEVGRAYFERVRDALAGLDEATAAALDAAREPHGVVRVAVPPFLAPALATPIAMFTRSYPKIRIEITVSGRAAGEVGEQVDIGIVVGQLPDSSLKSRRAGDNLHQLYAAPSYLEARGRPRSLADLTRHEAIVLPCNADRWELIGPQGVESVAVRGTVTSDHLYFVVEAAVAGLGIALLPVFTTAQHVRSGALEQVLPRFSAKLPIQLLTAAARHVPLRVSLLRNFLADHLEGACSGACPRASC